MACAPPVASASSGSCSCKCLLGILVTGIVGWSRGGADPHPSPAQWAGRPAYYRIALTEYRGFPRSVPVSDFVERSQTAISEEGGVRSRLLLRKVGSSARKASSLDVEGA